MSVLPQIILLVLLIACNGFFVASEFSLVKVRRTRIDLLVNLKSKRAKLVQSALQNPMKYFSVTQLGITLSSLALGSIGEPIVADSVKKILVFLPQQIGVISSHAVAITIGFTLITFLQIIFGELIPRNIAIKKPEQIILTNIGFLFLFLIIFQPVIMFLSFLADGIVRIIGIKPSPKPSVSKEEIKLILSRSAESGVLDKQEMFMIQKVFQISETPVTAIMVPNNNVIAINELSTIENAIKKADGEYVHSRFPVYQYSINNVVGFIHVVDLHHAILKGYASKTIASLDILRDIAVIDSRARVDDVLKIMNRHEADLAVIKDQKQKTIGIVTIEDIVDQFT